MASERAADITAIPGLRELWLETTGDPRVCVAILDGTVDLQHPSLVTAGLSEVDVLGRGGQHGKPPSFHGTHVASILFGKHGGPIAGIAPICRGIIIPVYRDDGKQQTCTQEDLAAAIMEAVHQGAHVINVSGGEFSGNGTAGSELNEAVRACHEARRLLVAAAGNEGCESCLHVPGALSTVLAVGAMDEHGQPLKRSNWGDAYRDRGVLALGANVLVGQPGGGVTTASGTSYATPVVSGIAALLLSLQLKRGPKLDPLAARSAILRSASGCPPPLRGTSACGRLLAGRLNVPGSVSLITLSHDTPAMNTTTENATSRELTGPDASPEVKNMGECVMPASSELAGQRPSPVRVDQSPRQSLPEGRVTPSDCGCGGKKAERQLVFVIGDKLDYDFGSPIRQRSIQNRYVTLSRGSRESGLHTPSNFLRYLLGYTEEGPDGEDVKHQGNLYEAKSVYWVLYQNGCPRYVLMPQGSFDDVLYKAILVFYIESLGIDDLLAATDGLDLTCLNGFFHCHGGRMDTLIDILAKQAEARNAEPKQEDDDRDLLGEIAILFGESSNTPSRIAVAGEVIGKVKLSNGDVVEILCPDLGGMSSWNTASLIEALLNNIESAYRKTNPKTDTENPDQFEARVGRYIDGQRRIVIGFAARILARLYAEVLNDGKVPEDRAKNWAATEFFFAIRPFLMSSIFLGQLGGLEDAAVNDVGVVRGNCLRTGGEYDVEISLYNAENTLRGLTILASTVDVSEMVPTTITDTRYYTRR